MFHKKMGTKGHRHWMRPVCQSISVTHRKIRKALRKQLGYVARDIRYLDGFMSRWYAMTDKEISRYLTILMLYEQQKYMYDNKVHAIGHRIVSITQPWLRPIVRGKAKAPVEFGAKFDLSLDSEGYGHIDCSVNLYGALNLEYDTDYVRYILDEMQVNDVRQKVFLFYALMYCVDFIGERGMQFMDKKVEVNEQIVKRLEDIYNKLWYEWCLTTK